jgi:restriction endonuclease S subunit
MNDNNKIFEIWSDELENRLDPFYYQPHFKKLFEVLRKSKYQTHKLSEIATIFSGQRPKGGVRNIESGIPSLGGEHVLALGEIKTEDIKYIPEEFHKKHLDKKVLSNDIILVKDGATTGKVGIIPEDYPFAECNINEHVFAIRATSDSILPKYLFSVLFSEIGQLQLSKNITGATVTGLTRESVESLLIPVPNEKVQQKIVEIIQKAYEEKRQKEAEIKMILAKIDSFVLGELGIKIERVSELAQIWQIWSDAIEKRLDPMFFHPLRLHAIEAIKNSNASVIPLSEAVKFRRELVSDIPENAPYIGLENIVSNSGEYVETNAKESISSAFVFKKGDVLFPKLRPYLNKVFYADFDGICSTEFHVFESEKCDPYFLFSFLTRSIVVEQTSRLMTGNTLPRLQTEDIENLLIPIPNETTQEKIISGVKTIYEKVKRLRQEAESVIAEAQKQTADLIFA